VKSGTNEAKFGVYDGSTTQTVTASEVVPTDTWTHIVGVYDGADLDIYYDTVNKGNNNIGSITIPASSEDLLLGAQKPDTTNRFLDGVIDDVRIFDVALSDDAIVDLFNLGDIPEGATFLPQVMII
jgi:hypothetical protein